MKGVLYKFNFENIVPIHFIILVVVHLTFEIKVFSNMETFKNLCLWHVHHFMIKQMISNKLVDGIHLVDLEIVPEIFHNYASGK